MKNKTAHKIREDLRANSPETVLDKLANICSAHSPLKSDEELRNSFESFFYGNHECMASAESGQFLNQFEFFKEVLPVLGELGEHLGVERDQSDVKEISQTDSSNRLFASVKRNPE